MRPWDPPEPAGPGCPDGFASLSACPRSAIGNLPGAAPFSPGYAVAYPAGPAPFSPGPPSASLEPSAVPPRQSRSSPWTRLQTARPDQASERGRAPRAPRAARAVAAEPARLLGPRLRRRPASSQSKSVCTFESAYRYSSQSLAGGGFGRLFLAPDVRTQHPNLE